RRLRRPRNGVERRGLTGADGRPNTFARSSSIAWVGPNEPTPGATGGAADEAPARSGRIGPRLRFALIAGAALVVSGAIYVATRDTSPQPLDKAEVWATTS